MTPAEKILSLIERVDPNDTAVLDEIDARVWCWINDKTYKGREGKGRFYCQHSWRDDAMLRARISKDMKYTRSRDALKAVRPDGWILNITTCNERGATAILFPMHDAEPCFNSGNTKSNIRRTEELAELHAILQAIEWERQNAK